MKMVKAIAKEDKGMLQDANIQPEKRECLRALEERHNMRHKAKEFKINVGYAVMIKRNNKKRKTWKTGITQEMYWRKDQVRQAVKIKTSKG